MIQTITHIMIISSLIIFGIALIICLFRLIKGPTTADRVVTFDTTSAVVMSIVGVLSVLNGHRFFPRFNHAHCHYIFCKLCIDFKIYWWGYVFNGNNKRNL
ncbi:Na+/H+ antiporter Mnh2 subunit F [Staphylococcus aureus]|nr:Na+/H+ antiporter Mnh2 subunit F [Staphylococcus aureus]WRN72870.1 Na+/H+ antiporter Mnh2 subunit F [Staphylococcus aureus]